MYFDIHTHLSKRKTPFSINSYDVGEISFSTLPVFPFSLGFHPYYLEREPTIDQKKLFVRMATSRSCVAIGECGLDKCVKSDWDLQIAVLRFQHKVSEDLAKPIILHLVRAWSDLFFLHKELRPKQPWIVHGFRKNITLAKQLIDRGIYLSFGVNFSVESLRLAYYSNRLLVESDNSGLPIEQIYLSQSEALNIPIDIYCKRVRLSISELWPSLLSPTFF
ncbi:TatD family hydrolase [Porphyromonas crevioricanis]|uniref:TatD family hydrolase n=1 Tax=Porphyromonas crevioricanis TaxID=393921 RepID=UPI0009DD13E5|nr:TatD family hydrolase [Porphyromonas crevioricanis]